MKALTTTVARILFAVPFLIFGLFHFMNGPGMAGMVPSYIPGGVFWVYLVGIALVAGSVSIMAQKMAKMACLGLAALLAIFILTIHLPGVMSEAGSQTSMIMLLKDTALMGGALTWAGIFEKSES